MTESAPTARILVVDDVTVNLDLLVNLLSDDYQVFAAPNGATALAIVREHPIDLILLDIVMPEMNGYQVCQHLKADPTTATIPVIFVTALAEIENETDGFEAGAVDYLLKPVQAPVLLARVATQVALRKARQQLEDYSHSLEAKVEARTQALHEKSQALAAANARLAAFDRLKWDFLRMINHELNTPLNGLLGTAEFLFSLIPDDQNKDEFIALHHRSRERILQLLEDIRQLYSLSSEDLSAHHAPVALAGAVRDVMASLQNTQTHQVAGLDGIETVRLDISPDFLYRSLTTLFQLAACFSPSGNSVALNCQLAADAVVLRFALEQLALSQEQCDDFFTVVSNVRGQSTAEILSLAPVVAERTIAILLKGQVRLLSTDAKNGVLEVRLPVG